MALVLLVVMLGFAALTVDVAVMYNTRSDLQRTADAGVLAAAAAYGNPANGTEAARLIAGRQMGLSYVLDNKVFGNVVTLDATADIVYGTAVFDPSGTAISFVPGEIEPNAVQLTVARAADSPNGPLSLLFANVFGISEANVSARAVAGLFPPKTADVVPLALRTPGFGVVDPDVFAANPGKDGPSEPANGAFFQIGEEVKLFTFGHGPEGPVHLVLDINATSTSNIDIMLNDILEGLEPPFPLTIGQELGVWGEGTGGGGLGHSLKHRLTDNDPSNDVIVVPIVETLVDSRNIFGHLTGNIRIADFAAVHLTEIRHDDVPLPGNPGQFVTVENLIGVVIQEMGGYGTDPNNTSGQFTDQSLLGAAMLIQ
ncbi:MAG: pilus assembly protein TadG-related protein [Phycisphaerae bacterium]